MHKPTMSWLSILSILILVIVLVPPSGALAGPPSPPDPDPRLFPGWATPIFSQTDPPPESPDWYWKNGGWTDYAPNGVPDFDQKQDMWDNPPGSDNWSYCGPVAAANSLWWFDSKFEPSPVAPPIVNDNYYLITSYQGGIDDHDPMNVGGMGQPGLVDDLGWYFDTDGVRTDIAHQGTEVHDMAHGLQWYLYGGNPAWGPSPFGGPRGSYYDDYHVQLVKMPTWEWVVEEVERSEDVILLLGFWQDHNPDPEMEEWARLGGHYVTVAGIDSTNGQIAFSDPYTDAAEFGAPGHVYSGTLTLPHNPGHGPAVHNDAGNVSHDIYGVDLIPTSPAGLWEIEGYPYDPNFARQNVPQEFGPIPSDYDPGLEIYVEVEYALAMSPFTWKPGGEWVDTYWMEEWITEWWWYEDDGDSCLPDFSWDLGDWEAFDGPTALANSLWWFDSKAETLVTGGYPQAPPTESDHYELVGPYGSWDDHAVSNTVPFIDDLGVNYLHTGPQGTTIPSMTTGISNYLAARGVASDFYMHTQDSPEWGWVADEVETCEDVILLLGFYEQVDMVWQRRGGHWVNAAGVSRANDLIGLSDPAINNAISESISSTLHLGRVFPPEHLGTVFSGTEQSAPQNLSHDIYRVITSTAHSDRLVLQTYPATSVITDFIGLNGGGGIWESGPISTVVEWAVAVSPYSDLTITKTAALTEVVPGDRVTYTIQYANRGLAAVHSVTITEQMPLDSLTDIACTSYPPLVDTPGYTYVWSLPRLSYGQSGTITITAQSLVTDVITNTVTITGLTSIGNPTPDGNPHNNSVIIRGPQWDVYLPLVLRNF